jgi:hypothetical protein
VTSEQDGAAPPRGWEIPRASGPGDADALAQLVEQVLALVPEELRLRVTEAARALLEALRALIDWCVQRLERRHGDGAVEVRDIPIL